MIKIHVVKDCPYTRAGQGVLFMTPEVISTLAGAVYDQIEWLALLTGTRSKDGLTIKVTGLQIPEQYRGHANCELVNDEILDPNVIGVVHSHHSMGAFFSHTDDTKLNTRFPVSIVVAQLKPNSGEEERLLGFEYKAEGRTTLPCGDIGIVGFTVMPTPCPKDWPLEVTPQYGPTTPSSLAYCAHTTREMHGLEYRCKTSCGLEQTEPAQAIFGRGGAEFMQEVQKQTKGKYIPHYQQGRIYEGYYVNDKRYKRQDVYSEDDFLRHWSAYGGD